MLECQSSLTIQRWAIAISSPQCWAGARFLGTELEGRYERLLQDLRTTWSAEVERQAVAAIGVLQQRRDALEAALSRESPQFGAALSPASLKDIHVGPRCRRAVR